MTKKSSYVWLETIYRRCLWVSWLPGFRQGTGGTSVLRSLVQQALQPCLSDEASGHTSQCHHTHTPISVRRATRSKGHQPALPVCYEPSGVTLLEDSVASATVKALVNPCPSTQILMGPAQWKKGRSAKKTTLEASWPQLLEDKRLCFTVRKWYFELSST